MMTPETEESTIENVKKSEKIHGQYDTVRLQHYKRRRSASNASPSAIQENP